jgi:hypothetical protein
MTVAGPLNNYKNIENVQINVLCPVNHNLVFESNEHLGQG